MAQPSPNYASAKTETEVAVLQVQFQNLNEKVDDLKTDMQDLRTSLDDQSNETRKLIKEFQDENTKAHREMATKISALEKWRWMIMGAGITIGALGFEAIGKILGM